MLPYGFALLIVAVRAARCNRWSKVLRAAGLPSEMDGLETGWQHTADEARIVMSESLPDRGLIEGSAQPSCEERRLRGRRLGQDLRHLEGRRPGEPGMDGSPSGRRRQRPVVPLHGGRRDPESGNTVFVRVRGTDTDVGAAAPCRRTGRPGPQGPLLVSSTCVVDVDERRGWKPEETPTRERTGEAALERHDAARDSRRGRGGRPTRRVRAACSMAAGVYVAVSRPWPASLGPLARPVTDRG